MKKALESLKQYFWDINFDELDYKNHSRFVIERVLEYGDKNAIRWMMEEFSRAQIIHTLQRSRELTPKSAFFWMSILNVKQGKIRCLNKSFREIRKQFWPH